MNVKTVLKWAILCSDFYNLTCFKAFSLKSKGKIQSLGLEIAKKDKTIKCYTFSIGWEYFLTLVFNQGQNHISRALFSKTEAGFLSFIFHEELLIKQCSQIIF